MPLAVMVHARRAVVATAYKTLGKTGYAIEDRVTQQPPQSSVMGCCVDHVL